MVQIVRHGGTVVSGWDCDLTTVSSIPTTGHVIIAMGKKFNFILLSSQICKKKKNGYPLKGI